MTELYNLVLTDILINGGTQARTEINQSIVAEYAEAIRQGTDFPPVIVFEDGANFWLADGFHRYHAHKAAGAMNISCDMRTGTQREAVLYSLSANANHGLRRTNEDKRKAVLTLLNDTEWNAWSNVAISKACGVSDTFVGDIRKSIIGLTDDRKSISANAEMPVTRTVERNGKTYEQNTSNIGKTAVTPKTEKEVAPVVVAPVVDNPEDYVMPDESDSLPQIAENLQKERDAAVDLVKRYESTDVKKVTDDYDRLHNRLLCETQEKNDWIRKYNFQADLLKKICIAVGVKSSFDILAKLSKS